MFVQTARLYKIGYCFDLYTCMYLHMRVFYLVTECIAYLYSDFIGFMGAYLWLTNAGMGVCTGA